MKLFKKSNQNILRLACLAAMEMDGVSGYKLYMERNEGEAYAAVFIFGNHLALARIPDRRPAMLDVHISYFEQTT